MMSAANTRLRETQSETDKERDRERDREETHTERGETERETGRRHTPREERQRETHRERVVLSFLESRLPGVVFLTYKRMEGSPQLDSVVFGPRKKAICNHPLAMRIKNDGMDPTASNPVGSCIFGFDLRLVKTLLHVQLLEKMVLIRLNSTATQSTM
jgi:hypothetical protein